MPIACDIEALSREFAELTGICGHFGGVWCDGEKWTCETCGATVNGDAPKIDFTDAREVLEVMVDKGLLYEFLIKSGAGIGYKSANWVNTDLILDRTGLILKEAVEWLRKEKANAK